MEGKLLRERKYKGRLGEKEGSREAKQNRIRKVQKRRSVENTLLS
jgi:hypothetical protein